MTKLDRGQQYIKNKIYIETDLKEQVDRIEKQQDWIKSYLYGIGKHCNDIEKKVDALCEQEILKENHHCYMVNNKEKKLKGRGEKNK